ncbi:MAG: adenylosuccinate lyase [Acidimicrobiia bacterium]
MIDRYCTKEMKALFNDVSRMSTWLDVEVSVVKALADYGVIDQSIASEVEKTRPVIDENFVERVSEREAITHHDVAAFVDTVQADMNNESARYVHYGLTSSDVVDTAQCVMLVKAMNLILDEVKVLDSALLDCANKYRDSIMVGRTHGIHAEPTTFGTKVALWLLQLRRDTERLLDAKESIRVGKLSGAVGTYSNIDPEVEAKVCEQLGLVPVSATQVVARDRHAQMLYSLTSLAATIEQIALEIRHLQRTEVSEVFEPFAKGKQKGSSAMPHKRNPVKCEQLCGLARVLRGNLLAGVENVALWHERDISHSSVERIIFADSLTLAHYMTRSLSKIIDGLEVNEKRMLENIEASYGVVYSQTVLLSLVDAGLSRDDAYRIVQELAQRAFAERIQLQELCDKDDRVTSVLDNDKRTQCFNPQRLVKHSDVVFSQINENK